MSFNVLSLSDDSKNIIPLQSQLQVQELPSATDPLQGRLVNILSRIGIKNLETVHKIEAIIHDVFQDLSSNSLEKPIKISPQHKVIVFRNDSSIELYIYPTNQTSKLNCLESTSQALVQKGKSKSFREAFKIKIDVNNTSLIAKESPEKVALLKSDLSDTTTYPDKEAVFKHEVEILKTLKNSPHFSNLYASAIYEGSKNGKSARKGIMVQKFYPNGDYEDLLSKNLKTLSFNRSFKWLYVKELLTALYELENRKICHSDLTPSNIMLDENENAVFIDFEFALPLGELKTSNHDALIRQYLCRGTPELMPPEKIRAALADNYFFNSNVLKGNVWSVGCIIHYLLEGKWPDIVSKIGKYVVVKQKHALLGEKNNFAFSKEVLKNQENEIFQILEKMQRAADSANKDSIEYLYKMMLHPDPAKRFSAKEAKIFLMELSNYV